YANKPYDYYSNYDNSAYGTHFMSTTYLKGNFVRENIWKGLGAHVGVIIIHYSNGNLKAPNTSTNSMALNVGVNYQLEYDKFPEYNTQKDSLSSTHAQRIAYNFVFRGGINESDVIGLGQ